MKTIALIPVFGRHEILKKVLKQYQIDVYCVCDGPDAVLCQNFAPNIHVIVEKNDFPAKLQRGLEKLKGVEFDNVLMMGSDDLIDSALIDKMERLTANYEAIGLINCYFYDLRTRFTSIWPGYPAKGHRDGEPVGAFRMYTRKALDSVNWQLWDSKMGGMDKISWDAIERKNPTIKIDAIKEGHYPIDVKDDESQTHIGQFDYLDFPTIEQEEQVEKIYLSL